MNSFQCVCAQATVLTQGRTPTRGSGKGMISSRRGATTLRSVAERLRVSSAWRHRGTAHASCYSGEIPATGMPLCRPAPDKKERMYLRTLSFKIPVPRDPPARTHILAADRSAWRSVWSQGHRLYRLIDLRQTDTRPGGAYALFRRWPSTVRKGTASQGHFWTMHSDVLAD